MQKFLFILGIMVVTALFVCLVFFGLTPQGKAIWRSVTHKTDEISEAQRKEVETEARALIDAWQFASADYLEGDETAKERANKAAEEYNQYMAKWGYIFGETLPDGIYASIDIIE